MNDIEANLKMIVKWKKYMATFNLQFDFNKLSWSFMGKLLYGKSFFDV